MIKNNALNGLNVQGSTTRFNDLRDNIIDDNGALGIDLNVGGTDGTVTLNDADDSDSGPNGLQNFLELTSAEVTGRVQGQLTGPDGFYTIEIYQRDSCDGSGYGEGGDNRIRFIAAASVTGGVYTYDEVLSPAPPLGSYLVSLVTAPDGSTSEFGNCVQVVEASFVVNSTANFGDNDKGDGDCESNVTGDCTLRAVIEEINALSGGPYAVSFSFGLVVDRMIQPDDASAIPTITTPIILDATTYGDAVCPSGNAAANHRISLDGSNVTSGNGLRLAASASGSTIRGLHIRNFPDDGIRVDGDDNIIACNTLTGNGLRGVNVNGDDNRIGGTAHSERNVIHSNDGAGIRLGDTATRNKVQSNYIGVQGDGITAGGNDGSGVFLSGGGTNRIGGSVGFAANVIAANGGHGINLDPGNGNNQIWGNLIGLDAAGTTALGNMLNGIKVDSADGNEIGGDSDSKRNIIAANGDDGIELNSSNNVVQRNFIGTDITGLIGHGNGGHGIRILSGSLNQIGGDAEVDGNLIADNSDSGIRVEGTAVFTTIENNSIGVDSAENPLGNSKNGIILGDTSSQTTIRDNHIAHNGFDGIAVATTATVNKFRINRIYSNGELGIDLNNDDVVNANDTGDTDSGGNGLMNFPIILGANADTNTVTILLETRATVTPFTYRIHVYRNQTCDDSGHGQGERYVGSLDLTTTSNNGIVQETAALSGNFNTGEQLTATATPLDSTSPEDGTSEFSACFMKRRAARQRPL